MRTLRRQKDVLGAAAAIAIATVAVSCDRSRAGGESSPPTAPKPLATPGWFTSAQAPPPLELPGKVGNVCPIPAARTHR